MLRIWPEYPETQIVCWMLACVTPESATPGVHCGSGKSPLLWQVPLGLLGGSFGLTLSGAVRTGDAEALATAAFFFSCASLDVVLGNVFVRIRDAPPFRVHLGEPARCPNCKHKITEKTLTDPRRSF